MMQFKKVEVNATNIAIISGSEIVMTDVQSALDLMATIRYETDSDRMVIHKSVISESFFDLKTRLAGEILQKFINYQLKVAIVGDFSGYTSQSLRDFIYECNKGRDIFFVATEQEAIEKLSK
jgi:histidinol phosphatase-like PHP family hydrolase